MMVRETCAQLAFSPEYHLDVVDGQFVPAASWPYSPVGHPAEVQQFTDAYTLEVDLMVLDPLPAAEAWEAAGADMLVFHIETVSVEDLAAFASRTRATIGVSLHGDTPLADLTPYVPFAEYVQLMGIRTIGAQGLPFDERVLEWIPAVQKLYPEMMVSVDGSVNATTLPRLVAAGANRFICGSAIVGQPDPAAAHAALRALINDAS
jgi:ribulose-phosphate 3-epimerase